MHRHRQARVGNCRADNNLSGHSSPSNIELDDVEVEITSDSDIVFILRGFVESGRILGKLLPVLVLLIGKMALPMRIEYLAIADDTECVTWNDIGLLWLHIRGYALLLSCTTMTSSVNMLDPTFHAGDVHVADPTSIQC